LSVAAVEVVLARQEMVDVVAVVLEVFSIILVEHSVQEQLIQFLLVVAVLVDKDNLIPPLMEHLQFLLTHLPQEH
tara:strand:- start:365 stop:589 length:225 start_codon:yes stop_codon:yes gene_type:complete